MTTDKKAQEKPDATKQKAPRQQATKQKTVQKTHEKSVAHKAPASNTNRTVVVKQNMENTTQVPKKINVQDLFAAAGVSQTNGKQMHQTKQRTMSNNLPPQQQSTAPIMHKTRSYTYGTSMQTQMSYNVTPAKTRGASPPTGAYANPAYSDSPSARELPMPPLNWLFSDTKASTPTTTLSGTDFMRAFAVATVN
jgi:hypothetical protein